MNKDGNNYTIKKQHNSAEENIIYNSLPYTDNPTSFDSNQNDYNNKKRES